MDLILPGLFMFLSFLLLLLPSVAAVGAMGKASRWRAVLYRDELSVSSLLVICLLSALLRA